MPIWLRKFTFKKLSEFYDAQVKANSPKKGNSNIDFANPDKSKVPIKKTVTPPSYITKKSKK
jgi:hypothetical protein